MWYSANYSFVPFHFIKVTEKPERDQYIHDADSSCSMTAAGKVCSDFDATQPADSVLIVFYGQA